MNLTMSILVGAFLTVFAIVLIREEILRKFYGILKLIPKFARIILFIIAAALLIFLIVLETMQFFK